jgi:ribosomal-protein-serine acetyltransferase
VDVPKETLTGRTILLRPLTAADLSQVYDAVQESVEQLSPWLPDLNASLSREDIIAWGVAGDRAWSAGMAYNFAIIDATTGLLLGGCGLTNINRGHRFANLYYWVRTSATGHGVATEATRLIARFGLERLGLERIEIVVAVGNEPSMRVAEKAGAKREGTLRNRLTMHGTSYDAAMFSLTPADLGITQ